MLCSLRTLAFLGICGVLSAGGCDSSAPKPAPVTPVTTAPERPKIVKDPVKVLAEAIEAAGKVRAVSYKASLGEGKAGGEVAARRAEAGGWLLHVKGSATPPSTAGATTPPVAQTLEIGYDGATIRSVRSEDKVVLERSGLEWADLAAFLETQGARGLVAWEFMGEAGEEGPLGPEAEPVFEGQETLDNVVCDLLRIPAPGAGAIEPVEGTRLAIAVSDRLPRRIIRPNGETLLLTSLAIDMDAKGGVYALPTPSGFRIRDPGGGERSLFASGDSDDAVAKAKEQILGDPEGRKALSMEPLKVGDAAPDWELPSPDGKAVKLADYRGKVLVMDFWGTWCGWCIKAMPALERVHEKYKNKGVVVLGVNTENDPSVDAAAFMKRNKFTYPTVLNAEKITRAYKVFGYPQLYVIGADGKVVGVEQGYSETLEAKLSAIIDANLPTN